MSREEIVLLVLMFERNILDLDLLILEVTVLLNKIGM
jgi:hypothetical protein